MDSEKAKMCAEYEIGWWEDHGRKNYRGVFNDMVNLYVLQYDLLKTVAEQAVNLRILAAKEHDVAESLERKNKKKEAKIHWDAAENLLAQHFKYLP